MTKRSPYVIALLGMFKAFSIALMRLKKRRGSLLCGWVRNLAGGSVEAYACGTADPIRQFERWLAQGSRFAKFESFEAYEALVENHDDFEVRSD